MEEKNDVNDFKEKFELVLKALEDEELKKKVKDTLSTKLGLATNESFKEFKKDLATKDSVKELKEELKGLNNRVNELDMKMSLTIERLERVEQKLYGVDFIKRAIAGEGISAFRPRNAYTRESIVPVSISSYEIREIPDKQWDEP